MVESRRNSTHGAKVVLRLVPAGALALAASPAALAEERGRPGQPGAGDRDDCVPTLRKHALKRFLGWTD